MQDLKTFDKKDLETLYKYFKVDTIKNLAKAIYSTASLPKGTIWDTITNQDYAKFLEFVNDTNFDPNQKTETGNNLLLYIIDLNIQNKILFINALIEKGINVNITDRLNTTPLLEALIVNSDTSIIETLLKAGADPNKQNIILISPILEAIRSTNYPIVNLLLKYGAKPELSDLIYSLNPYALIDLFIKYGAFDEYHFKLKSKNNDRYFEIYVSGRLNYLKQELNKYTIDFSADELEYLNNECSWKELEYFNDQVEHLKKCIELAKKMLELKPGSEIYKELKEKYKEHYYFK